MTGRRTLWLAAALLAPSGAATAQTFETAMTGWLASVERSLSALSVDTRQDSLVTQQSAVASTDAAMGLAGVIVEQEAAIAAHEAVARYESMAVDPITGLCAASDAQAGAIRAKEAQAGMTAAFDDFEREWLAEGGDRTQTLVATHWMRRTAFCSQGERALGLCDGEAAFGVPVAGDSDASPWLVRRSYGSAEVDVGSVFVDTVAPLPTILTAEEAASGSVADLVERAARRREAALVALARSGLTGVLARGLEGGTAE